MTERIKEIKELLSTTPQELKKEVSIIFDGKQYTIRIPRNLAEKIALNPEADKFLFKLGIPSNPEEKMKLTAELVKK
jgi:L-lysine 2,3-aminomutase